MKHTKHCISINILFLEKRMDKTDLCKVNFFLEILQESLDDLQEFLFTGS